MPKLHGRKRLNLDIEAILYNRFAKLCIDLGKTKTQMITAAIKGILLRHGRDKSKAKAIEGLESLDERDTE